MGYSRFDAEPRYRPAWNAGENVRSSHNATDPDLVQVTTSQLAINWQVEQSFFPQSSLAIEVETNRPYLLLSERAFRTYLLASVPSSSALHGRIIL